MILFLEKSKSLTQFDEKDCFKILIEKCIASGKQNLKNLSFEIIVILFQKYKKESIFEFLLISLTNKNQKVLILNIYIKKKIIIKKVIIAGIHATLELLKNYGIKEMQYLKPFFPEIEKISLSTNAGLRTEGMNFYKESYKWLGEAAKVFTSIILFS